MSAKNLLNILVLFLWVEFFISWVIYSDYRIILLWVFNLILISILEVDRIKGFLNFIKNKFFKSQDLENINEECFEMWDIVKYYNRHYLLFILWIVFVIALFDSFFNLKYWLNLKISGILFVISFLIWIKDVFNTNVYIWKKNLSLRAFVLILSFVLSGVFFFSLNWFNLSQRFFISITIWIVFYLSIVIIFSIVIRPWILFRQISFWIYLLLFLVSLGLFGWNNFDKFTSIFKKEVIVYQDKIIYMEPPTHWGLTTENADEILWTVGWVFSWDVLSWTLSGENKKNIANLDTSKISDNETKQLIDSLKTLMKDESGSASSEQTKVVVLTWKILTYRDVIPYLMKKYEISSQKPDVSFKSIAKTDPDYAYFKAAYYLKLFWTNSNPDAKLVCENFAVLYGMIKGWDVKYDKTNIFDMYWERSLLENSNFKNYSRKQWLTYEIINSIIK